MGGFSYVRQELINFIKRTSFKKLKHPEIYHALKTTGIFVIPDFMSPEVCAELRQEIDRLIQKYEGQIWTDALQSDRRIFGAEEVSEKFKIYFQNEFIRSVILEFEQGSELKGFTMAARLDFKPGNRGSGNGWHRDSAHYSQAKSILYLSDTTLDNGPFEYVTGSQSASAYIRGLIHQSYALDQFRFTDEEVQKHLRKFPNQKAVKFPAKAGTLLLVDTRGLHRGSPIETGTRYAATNYFFVNVDPPLHLIQHKVKLT